MATGDGKDHPLYRERAEPAPAQAAGKVKVPPRPLRQQALLTCGLAAINALVYLAGFVSQPLEWELFLRGALFPRLVVEYGEAYRLFTAMFLHGSLGHVFFNVYALLIFGRSLEPVFGRIRLLLIYLLGGLTGSALSLWLGGLDGASVGASGAVFAIFAAQGVHLYLNSQGLSRCSRAAAAHGIPWRASTCSSASCPARASTIGGISAACWAARCCLGALARASPGRGLGQAGAASRGGCDRNPLRTRWREVALYAAALAGCVVGAIAVLGA